MFKRSEAILLVIISLIKKANSYDSYGDYEDQVRDYNDPLYQRSVSEEKPSGDAEPSNFIDLKVPGVHPEKVCNLFYFYCVLKLFGTWCSVASCRDGR